MVPTKEAPMANYRLYELDDAGHICRVIILEAPDDRQAIALSKEVYNIHGLELWSGARIISTLPPNVRPRVEPVPEIEKPSPSVKSTCKSPG
jgi:hypothetical protein